MVEPDIITNVFSIRSQLENEETEPKFCLVDHLLLKIPRFDSSQ